MSLQKELEREAAISDLTARVIELESQLAELIENQITSATTKDRSGMYLYSEPTISPEDVMRVRSCVKAGCDRLREFGGTETIVPRKVGQAHTWLIRASQILGIEK